MSQLQLFHRRYEVPISKSSWVEDGRVIELWVGPHSFDLDWLFLPENRRETRTP